MPNTPVSVSNTFSSRSGKIRLSLIDTDFQDLVDFLNTVLNYSTYALDTGVANAYVVTLNGGLTFSLTAGVKLQVKIAQTNTGASTLVVNAGAVTAIKTQGGAALSAGMLTAGGLYELQFDGTNWQMPLSVTNALTSGAIGVTVQAYDANTAKLNVVQSWTKAQRGTPVALTSASNSIAIDLSLANNFTHTTSEDTTLAAPSNALAGQAGTIIFTQGNPVRTLAYNSFWKAPGGTAPTLTATVGAVDALSYYIESASRGTINMLNDVK